MTKIILYYADNRTILTAQFNVKYLIKINLLFKQIYYLCCGFYFNISWLKQVLILSLYMFLW